MQRTYLPTKQYGTDSLAVSAVVPSFSIPSTLEEFTHSKRSASMSSQALDFTEWLSWSHLSSPIQQHTGMFPRDSGHQHT